MVFFINEMLKEINCWIILSPNGILPTLANKLWLLVDNIVVEFLKTEDPPLPATLLGERPPFLTLFTETYELVVATDFIKTRDNGYVSSKEVFDGFIDFYNESINRNNTEYI